MVGFGNTGLRAAQVANQANNSIHYNNNFGSALVKAIDSWQGMDKFMEEKKARENELAKQGFLEEAGIKNADGDSAGAEQALYKADPFKFLRYKNDLQNGGGIKGEFGYLLNNVELPQEKKSALITQKLETMAKGYDTLYGQAQAQALGKGSGELQYARPLAEQKAYGKKFGEGRMDYEVAEASLPSFEAVVDKLRNLSKDATFTSAGRFMNEARKELGYTPTTGAVAREEYSQTVANELIPKLREMMGAQFTEKDRESVTAMLGDVNKTPEEKQAALRAFIEAKRRQVNQYHKQYGGNEKNIGGNAQDNGVSGIGNNSNDVIDYTVFMGD